MARRLDITTNQGWFLVRWRRRDSSRPLVTLFRSFGGGTLMHSKRPNGIAETVARFAGPPQIEGVSP
jgi:hypothetical protein